MIEFAISFIAGIAAFKFITFFPISLLFISILTGSVLFMICGAKGKSIILLFCSCVAGFSYSSLRQESLPEITFSDQDLIVEGTVANVPEMSGEKLRFTIDAVTVEKQKLQGRVRLVVYPEMFGSSFNESMFQPGSRIRAMAKLREPGMLRNPGVYSQDLKHSGIAAVGYVKQARLINRTESLPAFISGKRQNLGKIIDESLNAENAAFYKAIIPGLKRGISQDMRDAFSSTGLAHLLSISGTHFGLLALMVFAVIRSAVQLLPNSCLVGLTLYITPARIAILCTTPVLVLYAVMSGLSTPTIRSFIMVAIYMLALFLGRRGQWLNSLAIAAVIILLWRPDALFELSFLLSFMAVLSIGYVLEQRSRFENNSSQLRFHKGGKVSFMKGLARAMKASGEKIKTGVLITISAVLGTAPIVALVFKQFPLLSPLTNLVITPFVCFIILPLGLAAGCISLIFDLPLLPFSGVIDGVTFFTLNLIKGFSEIPFSFVHVHNPSAAVIVMYYLCLILFIGSNMKWRIIPIALVVCMYLVSPLLFHHNLSVTFLDAGQGDSAVIVLPDKKVMLVDGSTGEPDIGRMAIAPYLRSRGIRTIDYMVMSHPHPDHYGGLVSLLDRFDVREIWLNSTAVHAAEEFLIEIIKRGVPYKVPERGDVLVADRYKVYVLHPYDEFHARSSRGEFSNQNSSSLVLKIESDDASVLFTGDIEEEAEENLSYLGNWLKSDIIKVPHHGGRTSSSHAFLKAVDPEIAVVSAGRNNMFRHPHRESLERYRSSGVSVYRTDRDGAVTIRAVNKSYEIETYEDSRFKEVESWQDEIRNLKLLF
jgi:competence protein ComEC